MTEEQIVRSEAQIFAEKRVTPSQSVGQSLHKEVIQLIREELANYYSPSLKMYFLDEVLTLASKAFADHLKVCSNPVECSLNPFFEKVIFFTQQEVDFLPKVVHKNKVAPLTTRDKVFISYSHADKKWLDHLKRHFKPLEERIDFWDDSKITPGKIWKEEIKANINQTKVAILLVSADFFNSEFILQDELPPLLEAAEKEGATILSVVLKPCQFDEYPQIAKYQAVNSPKKPVARMDECDIDELWVNLVQQVKEIIQN